MNHNIFDIETLNFFLNVTWDQLNLGLGGDTQPDIWNAVARRVNLRLNTRAFRGNEDAMMHIARLSRILTRDATLHYNPIVDSGISIGGHTRQNLLLTLNELIINREGLMPSPETMAILSYVSQLTVGPDLPLDASGWSEGLVAQHVVCLWSFIFTADHYGIWNEAAPVPVHTVIIPEVPISEIALGFGFSFIGCLGCMAIDWYFDISPSVTEIIKIYKF